MTTRYQAGRESEYKAQRELEAEGYCTIRAAGSKGKIDVLAWNATETRFIQVKTFLTKAGSYAADIKAIEGLSFPPGSTVELWVRQRGRPGWLHKHILRRA